jgi:hypothetical protein
MYSPKIYISPTNPKRHKDQSTGSEPLSNIIESACSINDPPNYPMSVIRDVDQQSREIHAGEL